MRQIRSVLAALSVASILAACGSSGSGDGSGVAPVQTITGLASGGAALANAAVSVKCTAGPALSGKTASDGTFSFSLDGGQTLPCMLQVTNGTVTYYSFSAGAGRVNVTPLSDLVVTSALGSDAAAAFAGFNAGTGATIMAGLTAAKAYLKTQETALNIGIPSGDPLTGAFSVGDADDKILDKLNAALAAAGKGLGDLRVGAMTEGSLTATLARGT